MEQFTYEVIENDNGTIIVRSDGWQIPAVPGNSMYDAYLATLEVKSKK